MTSKMTMALQMNPCTVETNESEKIEKRCLTGEEAQSLTLEGLVADFEEVWHMELAVETSSFHLVQVVEEEFHPSLDLITFCLLAPDQLLLHQHLEVILVGFLEVTLEDHMFPEDIQQIYIIWDQVHSILAQEDPIPQWLVHLVVEEDQVFHLVGDEVGQWVLEGDFLDQEGQ